MIWLSHRPSKIGQHIRKQSFQKMTITKHLLLNWYSSIKKKSERFEWFLTTLENWLWKSDLGTFWRPIWTSVKVKWKNYFSFTDFVLLRDHPFKTSANFHYFWPLATPLRWQFLKQKQQNLLFYSTVNWRFCLMKEW